MAVQFHSKFSFFLDIFSGAHLLSQWLRKLCADTTEPVDLILGFHCDLLDEKMFNNGFSCIRFDRRRLGCSILLEK